MATSTGLLVGAGALPAGGKLIASADYSAVDPVAVEFPTLGAVGVTITTVMSAATGAGNTVTLNIEYFDPASGTWQPLLYAAAPAFTSAVATFVVTIDPRIATVASKSVQQPVPDRLRVRPVGSGTRTTLAYSVGAILSL